MLVILRLSLGCHFLYEGVWKIKHADIFTAAPFLSEAKGPMAPLFYTMLPDIDGHQRLGVRKGEGGLELAVEKDAQGKVIYEGLKEEEKGKTVLFESPNLLPAGGKEKVVKQWPKYKVEAYVSAWSDLKDRAAEFYKLTDEQKAEIQKLFDRYASSAREYVADNADEILAHYKSRERFELQHAAGNNGALHQRERDWTRERELRRESDKWLAELDTMGRDYQMAFWNVLDADQRAKGPITRGWNPVKWGRMDQINMAVTWALTAIGLCLMLGFFTRLAALGGACFMFFVVLTQPAWPGLYPADPAVVGHALLINKDFVEMVALLVVATTAAGRWAGLDHFVHTLLVRPFLSKPDAQKK